MRTPSTGQQSPSRIMLSTATRSPNRLPKRWSSSRYGARDIDSIPPATTTSASPERISSAPRFTAFSALAHTLFTVNDDTVAGNPAFSPA